MSARRKCAVGPCRHHAVYWDDVGLRRRDGSIVSGPVCRWHAVVARDRRRRAPLGPSEWRRFLSDEEEDPPRDGRFGWGWALVIGIVLGLLMGRCG